MVKFTISNLAFLLTLSLVAENAQANNTYNFYFVKDGQKKIEKKEDQKEETAPSVALPIEEKKTEPVVNKVKSTPALPAEKKNFKKFMVSAGVGLMSGSYTTTTPPSNIDDMMFGGSINTIDYNQRLYSIEGRYYFNRYFDVGGELLLPSGDAEYSGYWGPGGNNSSMSAQLGLLMGITPFHFTIFGAQFMEIGGDIRVLATDSAYTDSGNIKPMLGPRMAFNFGEKIALTLAAKTVTSGDDDLWYATMKMGYRW